MSDISNTGVDCQNTGVVNVGVNGFSTVNSECSIDIEKNLTLPETCISMNTGKSVNCSSTSKNDQLVGGNNFYPNYEQKGGYISIYMKDSGYFKTDIELNGKAKTNGRDYDCSFDLIDNVSGYKLIYRHIDVADPFVQRFKTVDKRQIGRNFSNSEYNFVKVIKSDIWNNDDYDYLYRMSKVNINNIKKNTISEKEKAESYLGKDCYFNNQNQYICPFTRNLNSNNNFFTLANPK